MDQQLTAEDAKQSLTAHISVKGDEIRSNYGPKIGWDELLLILADRLVCRYPCEIIFDDAPLQEGEFAFPKPRGQLPEEGFTLFVHPYFQQDLDRVPYLALYQLVLVNYGEFVSSLDAESFGAAAFGLSNEEYYGHICAMADEIMSCSEASCCCNRP